MKYVIDRLKEITMNYVIDRLKEPSSWRGLVMIATALGVTTNPDLIDSIVVAGTGLSGLIGFAFKDRLK